MLSPTGPTGYNQITKYKNENRKNNIKIYKHICLIRLNILLI